ncbi:MAG: hypothetical protein VKK80_00785 [Prochlorothrix sp.]|nr:hypothetical protein [Prochlorothrix sp.]
MTWKTYDLDRIAQKLVLDARKEADSLNQSHKMRMAVAYGLERFWGEHLRLQGKEEAKSKYWKATWDQFCQVMGKAGITLPNEAIRADDTQAIQRVSERLWQLEPEDQRICLAVLTQLCDSLVWWTQRYKIKRGGSDGDS